MSRRFRRLPLIFGIILVFLLGVSATGFAQEAGSESLTFAADAAVTQQEETDRSVIDYAARTDDGRILVYVELQAEAAAVTYARSGGDAGGNLSEDMKTSQRQIVQAEQGAFLANVAAQGINLQVLEQTDTVLNTIMVAVAESDLAALRLRPEVRNVYPVALFEREHQTSVPMIGAPQAWNGSFGGEYTGEGIVIAIIDSGIDYSHRNFGGSGVWPTNPALRTSIGGIGDETFPNTKVIGGWDYVGDAYNGGQPGASGTPASNTAVPDPDPIDCSIRPADLAATFGITPGEAASGHGTHVAGTAAGYGVNADGTTYDAGYALALPSDMIVGPGVAPEASLLALRVFGCYGSTGFALAALDDAVAGTRGAVADVVNMSLGSHSGYSGDDPWINPYVTAIANATAGGTLVVMSAGNNFDTHFITGSPGSTPAGVSVASVSDGDFPQITVSGTTADGNYAVRNSNGSPPNALLGPLPLAFPSGNGCTAATYNSFPAGRIAMVLFTGACGSNGLINAAAAASPNKPLGLLVISNAPGDFQNLACNATTPYIPCVSITSTLGDLLTANIATAQVTFNPALVGIDSTFVDSISSFSSRGTGRDNLNGIKPDIAAPGGSILSAGAGTGTLGQFLGGTSMAAPHIAGVAALLMSSPTYANWSTAQIKALMMNTANNDVFFNVTGRPRLGPQRAGSGRVDVPDAFSNQVIAYNALRPDVVSVSFGDVEYLPGVASSQERFVTVANRSSVPVTYNFAIDTHTDANGASFAVDTDIVTAGIQSGSVTIPPMDSVDVRVVLDLNLPTTGVQPHNRSDATQQTAQPNSAGTLVARSWITEEGAILELTPTAGATIPLRVPLYAAPRAASAIRAANTIVSVEGTTGAGVVRLSGTGVDTGNVVPLDIESVTSIFEFTGADLVGDASYAGVPEADLQYVGVASNFDQPGGNTAGSANNNTLVSFAVSTASEWETLNELSFRIYIDGLGNGFGNQPDNYVSFAQSTTSNNTVSDIFNHFWRISTSGSGFNHGTPNWFAPNQVDTYLHNNNVIVLPLLPGVALNYDGVGATPNTSVLAPGDTDFHFYVETFHRNFGVVDTTPVMYYNLAAPVIDTVADSGTVNSLPAYPAMNNVNAVFDFNLNNWNPANPRPQILAIHHHNNAAVQNADGLTFRRAELIRLDFDTANLGVSLDLSAEDAYFYSSRSVHAGVVPLNSGDDPATPVVTIPLPDSVSYLGGDDVCSHTGEPVGGTVTCAWTSPLLQGDSGYAMFHLDVDPNFVGVLSLTATVDDAGGLVDTDGSNNSASDDVAVPPMPPTAMMPMGDVMTGNPPFAWNNVVGGQWYQLRLLEVGSEPDVVVAEIWYDGGVVCIGDTCSVNPMLNLPTGEYWYYLRAWHATGGYSKWNDPTPFTVATQTPTPTPIAPAGMTSSSNPTFQWTDVPGADEYYVWVDMTAGPDGGMHIIDTWVDDDMACDGFNCFADLGLNLGAGYYTFWVQAWSNTGGYSEWSMGLNFAVAIPPTTPVPITPMGSVMDTTPPFMWTTDPSAEWHYLWVSDANGTIWNQWYQDSAICIGTNCAVELPMAFSTGYYVWWVQSYSSVGGFSAWSSGTNFTMATPPAAPTQVAPMGVIGQGSTPTFIFNSVAGAEWYYVWVSGPSGHVFDLWFDSSVCAGAFCTAMPGMAMNTTGLYRWWVQAWSSAGGYGSWSGPAEFVVAAPEAGGSEEPAAPVTPEDPAPEAPAEGS